MTVNNLTYDDINFVAKYFDGNSRDEISTEVTLGEKTFKLPVIPANMKCVLDFDRAEWLSKNGYFYILHRFYPYEEILQWVKSMNVKKMLTSISVGVGEKDKQFLKSVLENDALLDYITIDIAHGHCRKMKEMVKFIKKLFPNPPFIIAGNVMTHRAVSDLKSWGVDCVKVGIGPGKACFLSDTKVITDAGYKNIQEINIGDKVLTHNNRFKKVTDLIQKYSDELIEVNGEICTKNHEFYVVNKTDLDKITDENIDKFAYWVFAESIEDNHLLVSIDQDQYQK